MLNQKIFFASISYLGNTLLGQDLGCFRKPALQRIKYVHIDLITDFHILVIPEVIIQAKAIKSGTVGALNSLINISFMCRDNQIFGNCTHILYQWFKNRFQIFQGFEFGLPCTDCPGNIRSQCSCKPFSLTHFGLVTMTDTINILWLSTLTLLGW